MKKVSMIVAMLIAFMLASLGAYAADENAVKPQTQTGDSSTKSSSGSNAPNGNYTSLGISSISSTYTTPVCIGTNCYKTLSGAQVSGFYQFPSMPNLVIGLGSDSESGTGSTITLTTGVVQYGIGLIGGFGAFDLGAIYSILNSTVKACVISSGVCASVSDTGSDFGFMGKLWLGDEKIFNIGLSLDKYSYTSSTNSYTSTGISGTWLPAKHHQLTLASSGTSDQTGTSLGTTSAFSYAYLF